jgi:predicted nucleic acid-binding protein
LIVLDASALMDFLLERGGHGDWVAKQLLEADSIHAPHLIDVEIASAVRKRESAGTISPRRGRETLEDLAATPLMRYPTTPLLGRIWELRSNLTAYDANYVALAEALNVPLVTTDLHLAEAPGHRARIEVYPGSPT